MATDYKNTLNLPKTDFPMKANLAQKEKEILEFWHMGRVYHTMQQRDLPLKYILHDGPPYANGHIHLGHTLNKVLKDMIVKFKAMKGHYAPFVPGWDCHGLPIEHQVDKKLGSKKATTPVLEKRNLCREYASKFLDIQRDEFKELGVFADWEAPYVTMDYTYESAIVKEFHKFVKNNAVYKGKKPVHWCPTCVTALAEAEVEYADKESPSIFVKFRVVNSFGRLPINEEKGTFLVIWTTTPWTLPANMALALHPDYRYKQIITDSGNIIIAEDLIKDCLEKTGIDEKSIEITDDAWTGKGLEGIVCEHPWIDRQVKTILGEHVTLEQGTGIVHTAPGHGEEDFDIGLKYGLDVYAPVDDRGRFTDDVQDFTGLNVFKANPEIINKIKDLDALLGDVAEIEHSYPHCWRCKRPVIFRATEQWFISMEKSNLRGLALSEIRNTEWIPGWGMDRIFGMVEKRPDWCISRQRTWGVPITLFKCRKCKEYVKDEGVMNKIEEEFATGGADVWFAKTVEDLLPSGFKCPECSSEEFDREKDILDVWFDSGVSHAAVMEMDKRLFSPANLYLEGSDQHRGWFQSSLLASVGTRGKAPYRAVLTHGFVVDGHGKKMSKSLGNVISPQDITKKYGAEILRLWSSSADYREDMRISDEILSRLVEAYRKIRNTARFLLGNIHDFDPASGMDVSEFPEIDRYALSLLQGLIRKVNNAYETFAFYEVYHSIYRFCIIDMSSFYLDILKDRLYTFKSDSDKRRASQYVLYNILISLSKMIAPILSFTAEEIWRHIPGTKEESVFLSTFPEPEPSLEDVALEKNWKKLQAIRDEINKALEVKRKDKFIGNSLEAKVSLYADKKNRAILEQYQSILPMIFIVSTVDVYDFTKSPGDAFKSADIASLSVIVQKADGQKCNRCWNWDVTVGNYKEFPDICKKCNEALTT